LREGREAPVVLAKVVESTRRWRRRHEPARRRRRVAAPWPLVALIGVAGAVWFAAALPPHAAGDHGADGALALHGDGAIAGNGVFTLCLRASQQNCVIDGDTIRYGGARIRLEGIDAPETHEPKCASEAARGRQATRRLLELINAGPFLLVRTGDRDEDRYGRKLRTLTRGGRSLSDVLIAEGLARPWDGARRSWCG
jgi:endonuclease YncB( thermonuclease family)